MVTETELERLEEQLHKTVLQLNAENIRRYPSIRECRDRLISMEVKVHKWRTQGRG